MELLLPKICHRAVSAVIPVQTVIESCVRWCTVPQVGKICKQLMAALNELQLFNEEDAF